jgi:hypothetical protein
MILLATRGDYKPPRAATSLVSSPCDALAGLEQNSKSNKDNRRPKHEPNALLRLGISGAAL